MPIGNDGLTFQRMPSRPGMMNNARKNAAVPATNRLPRTASVASSRTKRPGGVSIVRRCVLFMGTFCYGWTSVNVLGTRPITRRRDQVAVLHDHLVHRPLAAA